LAAGGGKVATLGNGVNLTAPDFSQPPERQPGHRGQEVEQRRQEWHRGVSGIGRVITDYDCCANTSKNPQSLSATAAEVDHFLIGSKKLTISSIDQT
jgi:hypothetical protein